MIEADEIAYEPRPRDFAARYRRRQASSLRDQHLRRHRGRRAAIMLAAVAVPAMAAPSEWPESWDTFAIGDAGTEQAIISPMPFEQAGQSFPGSAFYYLAAHDDAPPPLAEGIHSDAEPAPQRIDPLAGPAARSLRIDMSGVDRTRALQCLTAAIYYEAASEPDPGQRAVAQVVLNRVAHPSYPNSVCGVVYQGSERRTGCQFSFTCDGSLARVPSRMFWLRAERVAADALAGYVYAPVGLATHYHTIAVHPYWASSLTHVGTIGAHRFYRFGGAAGRPATFRFAYLGGEPMPAPHRPADTLARDAVAVLDPAAVQKAYDQGIALAETGANPQTPHGASAMAGNTPAAHAPPAYANTVQQRGGDDIYKGNGLPQASGIRPEYENSGRWIARPES
ncbi:MAG: cell wall hydrolase [Novosphingobium sp.]|nr:cell wall hydrolase [Novosphingobium sp.]